MLKNCLSLFPLLFVLSCSDTPKSPPLPPADRESLRVLDINVWSGLDYEGYLKMGEYEKPEAREKRYQALIRQLKTLDPDVIGVHEANKLPDYAERLAKDLGYEAFYHVGVGGVRLGPIGLPWNLREGDAILTKKDLGAKFIARRQLSGGHVGNFFTFHFDDATQVIAVEITIGGSPIYLFATHWHASILMTDSIAAALVELERHNQDEEIEKIRQRIDDGTNWRLAEADKTLAFIREVAGQKPFILMGDFNATSESPEIRKLLQAGMVDAYRLKNPDQPGYTWDPETNLNYHQHYSPAAESEAETPEERIENLHRSTPKRIDFIFVGPKVSLDSSRINVLDSRVLMNEIVSEVHASDHYGVFAEIAFEAH